MEMNGSQRIEASREQVYAALNDVDILRQCIPGCESIEKTSDTDMNAKVTLRVGPVKASFTGKVTLSVDLRDLDPAKLDRFAAAFGRIGHEIGTATNTTVTVRQVTSSAPALAAPHVMDWIEASAVSLRLSRQRMPSGAGHDAQELALIAPMGMIFIPSVGGTSHSPREFSHAHDVVNGANVLLNAVIVADG